MRQDVFATGPVRERIGEFCGVRVRKAGVLWPAVAAHNVAVVGCCADGIVIMPEEVHMPRRAAIWHISS